MGYSCNDRNSFKYVIFGAMKTFLTLFLIFITHSDAISFQNNSLDDIFDIGTVQSLVIQKSDTIIYQEYRGSVSGNDPTNIKSASKSILSLLVGIAIEEGFLEGVDQPIGEFFPDYFEENPDSAKAAITIKDLLTMRSGLETTSFRNYGRWVTSSNWVEFILDQPFTEEPGGRMVYSTGTSHLLSVIITKATGMSTRAFANEYLFGPMDIQIGGWDRDPQGYYMGGNNLAVSPLDLVKIGEMVMNVGVYNEQQIVPKEWIMESIQVYTHSNFNPYNYGYMWWRRPIGDYQLFFAWGNGGQYIMMLPELNAVISITSDLGRSTGSRRYQDRIFTFLRDSLIPFIEESNPLRSS